MKGALAKAARVECPLLLDRFVTVQQHLDMRIGHARASTRNAECTELAELVIDVLMPLQCHPELAGECGR